MGRTSRWTTSISPWSLFTREMVAALPRVEPRRFILRISSASFRPQMEEEDLIIGSDFNLPGNDVYRGRLEWSDLFGRP